MDDYEKQMTGYLIVTILGGLFLLLESVVIEAGLKLYLIVFIGITLGAIETYLIAILIHIFKIPKEVLSAESITIQKEDIFKISKEILTKPTLIIPEEDKPVIPEAV